MWGPWRLLHPHRRRQVALWQTACQNLLLLLRLLLPLQPLQLLLHRLRLAGLIMVLCLLHLRRPHLRFQPRLAHLHRLHLHHQYSQVVLVKLVGFLHLLLRPVLRRFHPHPHPHLRRRYHRLLWLRAAQEQRHQRQI